MARDGSSAAREVDLRRERNQPPRARVSESNRRHCSGREGWLGTEAAEWNWIRTELAAGVLVEVFMLLPHQGSEGLILLRRRGAGSFRVWAYT